MRQHVGDEEVRRVAGRQHAHRNKRPVPQQQHDDLQRQQPALSRHLRCGGQSNNVNGLVLAYDGSGVSARRGRARQAEETRAFSRKWL